MVVARKLHSIFRSPSRKAEAGKETTRLTTRCRRKQSNADGRDRKVDTPEKCPRTGREKSIAKKVRQSKRDQHTKLGGKVTKV